MIILCSSMCGYKSSHFCTFRSILCLLDVVVVFDNSEVVMGSASIPYFHQYSLSFCLWGQSTSFDKADGQHLSDFDATSHI